MGKENTSQRDYDNKMFNNIKIVIMHKLFNCFTIVFATIMFVSCNEPAKKVEENVVVESEENGVNIEVILGDDSTSFHRVIDTIDFNNSLSRMEEKIMVIKEFHVESLADTAILRDKLSNLDISHELSYVDDLNPDSLLHSQKVRFYQTYLSFFEEMIRLEEELVSVGYAEKVEEGVLEYRDAFKKALDRELN